MITLAVPWTQILRQNLGNGRYLDLIAGKNVLYNINDCIKTVTRINQFDLGLPNQEFQSSSHFYK